MSKVGAEISSFNSGSFGKVIRAARSRAGELESLD